MIKINLDKAKQIAHDKRREARAEEFKPHDEIIMKQIPGMAMDEAEAARQVIREKYAEMQVQIDLARTVEELKAAMPS
jgi:hypothetical protein